jgi:Flp pilus assembly protein TadB
LVGPDTHRLVASSPGRGEGKLHGRPMTTSQFLIAFALGAGAGTAVFFHADRNHVRHPSAWASFVFLFLLIGLPAYLFKVRRVRRARRGGAGSGDG